MTQNCCKPWDEGWEWAQPCWIQRLLELGGIANLATLCSRSQARFSNLLSLTQIQNNMQIKNNNHNKKAPPPLQRAPRTRSPPQSQSREWAWEVGVSQGPGHGWEAAGEL